MRASCLKRAQRLSRPRSRVAVALTLVTVLLGPLGGAARANNGIPGSLGVLLAARQAPGDRPGDQLRAHHLRRRRHDLDLDLRAGRHLDGRRLRGRAAAPRSLLRAVADRRGSASPTTSRAAGSRRGARSPASRSPTSSPTRPIRCTSSPRPRRRPTPGTGAASVYVSTDGGATFGPTPLYTAAAGAAIVGIEIARSDPQIIYLTTYTSETGGYHPQSGPLERRRRQLDADRSARAARPGDRPDPGRRSG